MDLKTQNIIYCDFIHFYFNNHFGIEKSYIKTQYLKLLGELTSAPDLDDKLFEDNLKKFLSKLIFKKNNYCYFKYIKYSNIVMMKTTIIANMFKKHMIMAMIIKTMEK